MKKEVLHFTDRDLANRYLRELHLQGWHQTENAENPFGGRVATYTGKRTTVRSMGRTIFSTMLIGAHFRSFLDRRNEHCYSRNLEASKCYWVTLTRLKKPEGGAREEN